MILCIFAEDRGAYRRPAAGLGRVRGRRNIRIGAGIGTDRRLVPCPDRDLDRMVNYKFII